ncbi:trissin receptor [Scaptodrosophila lebanonensis]|uniref:Trissin receptor n=1 Tax=Drosophila lebanonensis TaxID=7225 RepID=A0A6J2TM34_DROLE|nr:trissin receptor [Scaptodrosophila lebanonensis]
MSLQGTWNALPKAADYEGKMAGTAAVDGKRQRLEPAALAMKAKVRHQRKQLKQQQQQRHKQRKLMRLDTSKAITTTTTTATTTSTTLWTWINISAGYSQHNNNNNGEYNDDDNDCDQHNQGTNSNNNNNNETLPMLSGSTNYGISGFKRRQILSNNTHQAKQQQKQEARQQPTGALLWHALLMLACSSTMALTMARPTNDTILLANISSTDLGLLFNDSTTPVTTVGSLPLTTALAVALGGAETKAATIDDLSDEEAESASEYIFDRTDVRIIFITLYTIVFCCCFFGNLLVILVVTLSRRLRSITNFFLANLAFADFCVGLFCVMQNLSIYLIDSWVFGEFLCRMYQFVHSLSYTASIFILVVICMERYFAIVHPITCKQILTAARLRMVIVTVWITSAVYSTPKFVFSKTIKNIHTEDGQEEEICVLDRKMFNSKLLDMINFVLLYVIPLLVMTVLYSKIAIALWRSSRGLTSHMAQQHHPHHPQQQQQTQDNGMGMHNSMYHHHHHHPHPHHHHQQHSQATGGSLSSSLTGGGSSGGGGGIGGGLLSLSRRQSSKYEKRGVSITESQLDNCKVSLESDRPIVSACRKTSFYQHSHTHHQRPGNNGGGGGGVSGAAHMSHSSSKVLRARRGVVRMLIIFVLTFALCNLPYHARKMWQYWSRSYRGDSNFNALLTPLTFLVTYFNSGVNPLLYAFLSRNFRKGMKELLLCSWKKGKGKSSSNSSMHHKRKALQTKPLLRPGQLPYL